ncbi:MAG: hypothetical protein ABGZ49_00255 [Akkermansiaceae bacterium]
MSSAPPDRSAEPVVLANPDTAPPPRPGNAAYFADLSCMFFDKKELTEALQKRVELLSSYGGRVRTDASFPGDPRNLLKGRPPGSDGIARPLSE